MAHTPRKQIQVELEKVQKEILGIGPMRSGQIGQVYTACQKPGCKCIDPVNPQKHGPFYKLCYKRRGKRSTQFIRPEFLEEVRGQIAAYHRFRDLTDKWAELAAELARLDLEEARSNTPKMRWPEEP
jgi:hypothetical protein